MEKSVGKVIFGDFLWKKCGKVIFGGKKCEKMIFGGKKCKKMIFGDF